MVFQKKEEKIKINSIKELIKILMGYKVISIIGLSKNVSKTTTLNHIINNMDNNVVLGLTSIGRDGEKYDSISNFPKPKIMVKSGTYIATAEESLKNTEIKIELLKRTRFSTPMGDVLIIKTVEDGFIELAGPSINSQLQKICQDLLQMGCNIVLIDGAFDRKSYATPTISEATILSTGASVSENMLEVINHTIHLINLFSIDKVSDDEVIDIAKKIINSAKIGVIKKDFTWVKFHIPTALDTAKEISEKIGDDVKYLVINSALTDSFLNDFIKFFKNYKNITILVPDSTKLFLSELAFKKFLKKGGKINVIQPIKIIAITINPMTPYGWCFDKVEFLRKLKERVNVPVFDLGSCLL
ncbi:MAG: hypothetical protein ACTSSM_11045 [Promethearchaeota archaeon]